MSFTIQPYEERFSDGYWHVRDMTYNDGQATPPENRRLKTTKAFVAHEDGRVMGVFNVLDLTCTRGDRATLKCAGIAGVAVLPEYRHLGVGSEMMRWSIPYLKEQGYHIASLYGFRESFYRKFGYEVAGLRFKMSVPTHRLPRLKPELPVGKIGWDEYSKLQPSHEKFVRQYSGMNVREDMHWNRVLNDKKTVYVAGDPIEAYAILDHKIDFWEPQWINEISWSSPAGYRSIMAVLSQISINKSALEWWEPYPSPFLIEFTDQGIEAKMDRAIMYRILDVPGTLSLLTAVNAGAFSVSVEDELIPDNRGPWVVTDSGEKVLCAPGSSPGISCSIQRWTQAYLGEPGVLGGVLEGPESDVRAAQRLLPSIPAYCQEFF